MGRTEYGIPFWVQLFIFLPSVRPPSLRPSFLNNQFRIRFFHEGLIWHDGGTEGRRKGRRVVGRMKMEAAAGEQPANPLSNRDKSGARRPRRRGGTSSFWARRHRQRQEGRARRPG